MAVNELIPWLGGIAVLITAIGGFLKIRSQIVYYDPETVNKLSDGLTEEINKRRNLESKFDVATRRIASLEHNERMNQHRMQAMEEQYQRDKERFTEEIERRDKLIASLFEGIEILINQIKRHDSSPHWTPDEINGAKDS